MRLRPTLCSLVIALSAVGCATTISEDDRTAIYAVLERQKMAWNDGDLDDYMDGYHRSGDVVFAAGGEFVRGWTALLARYRAGYEKGGMGRLTFWEIEIDGLGPDSALVRGHWRVEWPGRASAGGVFTLVLERFPEGWRITEDHTSSAPPAAS